MNIHQKDERISGCHVFVNKAISVWMIEWMHMNIHILICERMPHICQQCDKYVNGWVDAHKYAHIYLWANAIYSWTKQWLVHVVCTVREFGKVLIWFWWWTVWCVLVIWMYLWFEGSFACSCSDIQKYFCFEICFVFWFCTVCLPLECIDRGYSETFGNYGMYMFINMYIYMYTYICIYGLLRNFLKLQYIRCI